MAEMLHMTLISEQMGTKNNFLFLWGNYVGIILSHHFHTKSLQIQKAAKKNFFLLYIAKKMYKEMCKKSLMDRVYFKKTSKHTGVFNFSCNIQVLKETKIKKERFVGCWVAYRPGLYISAISILYCNMRQDIM